MAKVVANQENTFSVYDTAILFRETLEKENRDCKIISHQSFTNEKLWLFTITKFDVKQQKDIVITIQWQEFNFDRVLLRMTVLFEDECQMFETISGLLDKVYTILRKESDDEE